jgi:DNA-binding transcriptional ArsR family regulator
VVNSNARVTAVFSALADPTRRRILVRLSEGGSAAVTELSKPFRISSPAISRHLRVLEKARLIGRTKSGRVHMIRARQKGLKPANDFLMRLAVGIDQNFDTLEELLKIELAKGKQS